MGKKFGGILIDDADRFIESVVRSKNCPIKGISLSSDDVEMRFLNPLLPNELVRGYDMKTFVPGKTYIPPSGQEITQEDKDYLHSVVDSGWYTDGKECVRFRKELSKRVAGYVTLVNSGSSASLVAISSLVEWIGKIRDFTYVLTCATGFPTTVSPIYQCGLICFF